ncbi:MAG: HAD hydrolase-like protein [Proteobacteria bacterium]|nr:HAD hydrolase-like protein [Pseudomonadota bacterium]
MTNMIDAVIFDLDGVLWDTCSACAVAWNNVIKRNEIPFRDIKYDDVRAVTGLPHEQCIRKVFEGLPENHIQTLIAETQTEDNVMVEKLGGALYAGVPKGLQSLAKIFPLFIVSNCQSGYIETFLRVNSFESYFKDFECWGNTGNSKGANLRSVVERNKLHRPIFIGDTQGDQKAAFECDVPFWFVSYGFGSCSTFARTFQSFKELTHTILISLEARH